MSVLLEKPVVDLGGPDTDLLGQLLQVWHDKKPRNLERSVRYDGEQAFKDFGISLPPQMRDIGAALGWTAKGIHALTDLSQFEGFISASGVDDPFGLESLMFDNRFRIELPAASVSAAVHGCSFITVTEGDTQSGEPDVLMLARGADFSAAIWDNRKRALKGFLSIINTDDNGSPVEMVLYTPSSVYTITKGRVWSWESRANPLGFVTVAPLVHDLELRRPLGHSRISRASEYYADGGLRTIVRSEVSAEFYAAPEYWLFGADVSQFQGDDKWSAVMGRIKAMDVDDGDDKPELHRFAGASPQPHTDQLRMWQELFAKDQNMDVSFADSANPSSADAILAAKMPLVSSAMKFNELLGHGSVQAMQFAVMLRDELRAAPDEMKSMTARFTNPAIVSPSGRADSFSKLAANIVGFGESEVGMEYAGLSREQITRFQAEKKRVQAGSRLAELIEVGRAARAEVGNGDSGTGGTVSASEPIAGGSGTT